MLLAERDFPDQKIHYEGDNQHEKTNQKNL
jgi:hypothetical protein